VKGKSVQVHHIDDDPANNRIENFAVLCLECHTETQVSGGFRRKLDADQVILYRNDWLAIVARERASSPMRLPESSPEHDAVEIELATSIAEIYRDREEYELLASHYIQLGNDELRDKYVELAIEQGVDDSTLIFFRSVQGKAELIPQSVIERRKKTLEGRKDFFSLGRLYREIGEFRLAVEATCKGAQAAIRNGNIFSAAFHLKEMVEAESLEELFVLALDEAEREGDLWWQYRCLQELGWESEADDFLMRHRKEIEQTGEPQFLEVLTIALGDTEEYLALRKEEARSLSAKPEPGENIGK